MKEENRNKINKEDESYHTHVVVVCPSFLLLAQQDVLLVYRVHYHSLNLRPRKKSWFLGKLVLFKNQNVPIMLLRGTTKLTTFT